MRPPRLCTIYCIECLVEEQANRPGCVNPAWHILVESRVVPKQGQEVDYNKAEAGQCDGIGRHRHGKAVDNDIVVKGFEDVFRGQGMVDTGVLVAVETLQVLGANVDHLGPRTEH